MSEARRAWAKASEAGRSNALQSLKKLRDYYDDGANAWRRDGANDLASVLAMTAAGYDAAIAVLEEAAGEEE